jgi:hypothetical protein
LAREAATEDAAAPFAPDSLPRTAFPSAAAGRRTSDGGAAVLTDKGSGKGSDRGPGEVPGYLRDTYTWAYLTGLGTRLFDRQAVVNAILWGNAGRLIRWAVREVAAGHRVLQPAAVYGSFSRHLAEAVGPHGRLEVSDVAPIQVALTRRKLADLPQVEVLRADAATPGRGPYDTVVCFFLVHEVPEDVKGRIVDALLGSVAVGGKVVFVDYHRPRALHPLRPVMAGVFALLEPFAKVLWHRDIRSYATAPDAFAWRKETLFGGLYQKVTAVRGVADTPAA